jgi:hypothetical protein
MELPFNEEEVSKTIYLRTFYENVESGDLTWHRDREDRYIEPTHETNWVFQIDNELPQSITKKIFVPKGVYHRLIKGKGDLILKIEKLN